MVSFMKKILSKIEKIITAIESPQIPFGYFLLTFFFVVNLRNFLEQFLIGEIFFDVSFATFAHYFLSYVSLGLSFVIVFYFATKERVEKIARLILTCFLILNIVPIIELSIARWRVFSIGYMFPGQHDHLLLRFFTFGGSFNDLGITPAMRIEVGAVLMFSVIYFFIKNRNIIKSLIFSLITYSMLFAYGITPFIMKGFLDIFGMESDFTSLAMSYFFLSLVFILGFWVFYLYDRKWIVEIFKNDELLSFLNIGMVFFFGVALSDMNYDGTVRLTQYTLFQWVLMGMAICFVWLFSKTINSFAELEIAERNNIVTGMKIPKQGYGQLSLVFFTGAIIYSSAVHFRALFLISVFIGNCFIYSVPPLRLKRIPFFSKIFISLNIFILVILGHTFRVGDFRIPWTIIAFILICCTALANLTDIDSYEKDKRMMLKTLPSMLGLAKSKKVIGAFFFSAYSLLGLVFADNRLLLPSVALGAVQYFLINKKKYNTNWILFVSLLSIVLAIIYLKLWRATM